MSTQTINSGDRPEPERSPAPYGKTHLLPRAKNQKGQAAWRTPGTPDETSIDLAGLIGFAFSLDGRRGAQVLERFTDMAVARLRLVLLALIRVARTTPDPSNR